MNYSKQRKTKGLVGNEASMVASGTNATCSGDQAAAVHCASARTGAQPAAGAHLKQMAVHERLNDAS
jgi:hypothetical protein